MIFSELHLILLVFSKLAPMLELDAHSWVSLINESRVSASWVINSSLSTMFRKQRDELVLRKQAELNAIQRKSLSKTKVFGNA
jgi:hypothetical protein